MLSTVLLPLMIMLLVLFVALDDVIDVTGVVSYLCCCCC